MFNWIQHLPILWMTVVVVGGLLVLTAILHAIVFALAKGKRGVAFKGVSPGLLPPLGIIFGLLTGFVAADVWGGFENAKVAINREAGALREVTLIAASLGGESEARLRELVRKHIEIAVNKEWPSMEAQSANVMSSSAPLAEALKLAFALTPATDGQASAQRALAASLQSALEARRQRIIISESTVSWVKWTGILLQGFIALIAIALVHSDNRLSAALAMTLFATGMGLAIVLIAAYDRPFTGHLSVSPRILLEVMPEASGPAPA